MIASSFEILSNYCRGMSYKGYDLFDGLNSKLLKATSLGKFKYLRIAWIQFFKHCPVNLRPFAFVPKGYNAKGLALFASGLLKTGNVKESRALLAKLETMTCPGYKGISWGYNFDWAARAFFVPEGKPNLVTTVFVANSYLDYFDVTGDPDALRLARGACEFLLSHLVLFENGSDLCFGYIPGETARVHNANMMAAALLSRVNVHCHEEKLIEKSRKAMNYSVNALNEDFSWPYGERHHHRFIDNFHTGFNLVALYDWMKNTNENHWKHQLAGAYQFYKDVFWLENGCPKYYHNSLYPVDVHCSAQGIVTFVKFQDIDNQGKEMAEKVARWAIENMQDKRGRFYYQKTRFYMNRIPYIRWAQAWMFYALATYLSDMGHNRLGRRED